MEIHSNEHRASTDRCWCGTAAVPHWSPGTAWCHTESVHSQGTASSPADTEQCHQLSNMAAAAEAVRNPAAQVLVHHVHRVLLLWRHLQCDPAQQSIWCNVVIKDGITVFYESIPCTCFPIAPVNLFGILASERWQEASQPSIKVTSSLSWSKTSLTAWCYNNLDLTADRLSSPCTSAMWVVVLHPSIY